MPFLLEPTPTPAPTRLYHGGRGGAGNYHRAPPAPSPRTLPAPPTTLPPPPASFFTGRGGSGNVHHTSERTIFSFDEELERDRILAEHQAPVYSVGRGGAGNIVASPAGKRADAGSVRSVSTQASGSTLAAEDVYGVEKLWRGLKKVSSRRS